MIKIRQSIGQRTKQEDSFFAVENDEKIFAIVADGLGGVEGGDRISGIVVDCAKHFKTENSIANHSEFLPVFLEYTKKILMQNKELNNEISTTLAAILLTSTKAYICNIGDSRIYQFRDGEFIWVTKDHSEPQMMADKCMISQAEVEGHEMSSILYNVLTAGGQGDPEYFELHVEPNDIFILATDGFWQGATPDDMTALFDFSDASCDAILKLTEERGGENCDNITFIILKQNGF